MPMRAPTVDQYLTRLAEHGVEVEEIELPRVGRPAIPVITLVREDENGSRYMVPLGDLTRDDIVSPQLVDSWCDQLAIPPVGYGDPADY